MDFISCVAVILWGLAGAFWSRVDGGGILKTPNWFERLMCAVPALAYGVLHIDWTSPLVLTVWLLAGMGLGQYFAERKKEIPESREFVDPFVSLFFGDDPRFKDPNIQPSIWRCRFGMAVIGLCQFSGPVVHAAFIGDYLATGLFLAAGLWRALAYSFENTEHAEILNGYGRTIFSAITVYKG